MNISIRAECKQVSVPKFEWRTSEVKTDHLINQSSVTSRTCMNKTDNQIKCHDSEKMCIRIDKTSCTDRGQCARGHCRMRERAGRRT